MYSSSNDEKGRAILLMKTIMKINTGDESSNNVAIHLISSNINKKFQELEKLKIVISEIRKKKKDLLSSTATVTTSGVSSNISSNSNNSRSSSSSSSSNVNKNKNDDDYNLNKRKLDGTDNQHCIQMKKDEMRKRQYILKNNNYLYKQYNDLVIISKVLNDDDFWLAHEELFNQQDYPSSSSSLQSSLLSISKGKQNYFDIHDIIQINNNEITSIDLTLDIKNDLFNNNPWLKRAFQAEVPLRKSEQEFWTLYFEAEYFKILNKNNSNNNNNSYNNNNGYDYTKQLQFRYGDDDNNNNDSNTNNCNTNNHKKLLNIDSDIDLTSIYNDYHPHESLDTEDQNNDNNNNNHSGNNHQVILKYNQNSMNVLKSDKYLKNINYNHTNSSYEIHELENLHEPTYIPLKHTSTSTSTTSATTSSSSTLNDTCSDHKDKSVNNNDYNSIEHSKQEKLYDLSSSSSTKRQNILLYLEKQLNIKNDDTTNYTDNNYNDNDDIDDKSNYFNIYQQSKRGDKLFLNLTTKLLKASSSSSSSKSSKSLSNCTLNEFNNENYDATNTIRVEEEDGIDEEIKQELYEIYTDVTELLRHFYSMLTRCHHDNLNCNHITSSGCSGGRSSNSNMNKTEAILNRLLEIRENKLNVKKTNISTHYHTTNINIKNQYDHHRFLSSNERYTDKIAVVSGRNIVNSSSNDKKIAMSKVRFEASIAVINGINMLIRRAETTWNEFCTV
jgi:hypothetical protein